ncbi:unnamed protein product [Pleuronectes platessa]|uniref:Uncharacterized protein n=1 Tax=Pleuronectes platessa TaxID=8262 RepID=A0A9N7YJ56_PLEPL|nr:unnamed protein product [Pleuronectes platessa]
MKGSLGHLQTDRQRDRQTEGQTESCNYSSFSESPPCPDPQRPLKAPVEGFATASQEQQKKEEEELGALDAVHGAESHSVLSRPTTSFSLIALPRPSSPLPPHPESSPRLLGLCLLSITSRPSSTGPASIMDEPGGAGFTFNLPFTNRATEHVALRCPPLSDLLLPDSLTSPLLLLVSQSDASILKLTECSDAPKEARSISLFGYRLSKHYTGSCDDNEVTKQSHSRERAKGKQVIKATEEEEDGAGEVAQEVKGGEAEMERRALG